MSKFTASILTLFTLVSVSASRMWAGDFPNVPRTPGQLLAGPVHPQQGRTAIIAWHGGRIISVPEAPGSQEGADLRVRIVNLADPTNPQVTVMPYSAGGLNAHGYLQYGPYLFIGPHWDAGGEKWADSLRIAAPGIFEETNMEGDAGLPISTYNRSAAQSPNGAEMWWTYGEISGNAYLTFRRSLEEGTYNWETGLPTGPAVKATFDHLGATGVIGMPFIMGNILIYASDQSGTGVATYDISDPAKPVLLDVLKEGNPGGYWPQIYGHYIFFPRRDGEGGPNSQAGFMVVDFADPTNLRIVANRNLEGGNMYVSFQDEYAFMNKYKIDLRSFEPVLTIATNDTTLDASQFALPVGNLLVTGGYGSSGPGLAIWAHQAAPDTRGPWVAYHVPGNDQTNYSLVCPITLSIPETLRSETIVNGSTLIVRPVGGSAINTWHAFSEGSLLTVTPRQPLLPNTTYEVILTSGIQDAAGNGLEPYSFRFSTGAGVTGGNRPPAISAVTADPAVTLPGSSVNFNVSASDPEGGMLEYRFDYGDGTPRTAWQAAATSSHVYTTAKHYQVTVQARDTSGAVGTFSRGVTITVAPSGPRPMNSSPIALGSTQRLVWSVNPDTNTVAAIHADTLAKVWEKPTGADPRSIALAGDGTLWVACHDGDRIDVLDALSGAHIVSLGTGYGSAPVGVCANPDGTTVYASCTGDGTLRRFAVGSRSENAMLPLGPTPRAIAINGADSRAFVTRFISGPDEGSVYDVDLTSFTLTRTIRLKRDWVQDGSASGRGVPNYLAGIAITPDNTRAWIVGKKDNTDRGTFTSVKLPLGPDSTVRAQLMVIDLTTNEEEMSLRMDIDNSESPTAIAFSPLGDYAFIALQGNNQVFAVDYLEFMRPDSAKGVLTRLGTGLAPQGLVMDGTSGRLFTQDFLARSVTAINVAPLFSSGSLNLPSNSIATVSKELLQPAVLRGKRVFYNAGDPRMSAEGYISCASCHVDGGHDGRVWDFTQRGEGFRNTTDLRGRGGMSHGAVHWTANFDEIQDFENDIRTAFGGKGFMSNADFAATSNPLGTKKAGRSEVLDDLAAYVASLGGSSVPKSSRRMPDGTMTETASRGQTIFTREGCATCHVPATGFTDRTLHDVGTFRASSGRRISAPLSGIDTPTLLGVHAGAPYFHNGSAQTLAEVFTVVGGELRQAESGILAGGASADTIGRNSMTVWHGEYVVTLDDTNERITFTNIDGGNGGVGAIELRYAGAYVDSTVVITVNGQTLAPTPMPVTPSEPSWLLNELRVVRVPNVPFTAGKANTVVVRWTDGGVLSIDDVLFSTPHHTALAAPHRRVSTLTPGEIDDLIAYITQIDEKDAPPGPGIASISASPNPAAPGEVVQFDVAPTGNGPFDVIWSFGDGATGVGTTTGHAFAAAGTYTVAVSITDAAQHITVTSITINVVVGGGGGSGSPDSDGDGVPDDDELEDGTDPNDPNSFEKFAMTVNKAAAKMNFKAAGKDNVSFDGTLALLPGFIPSGQPVKVNIGGATAAFTLDAKGKGKIATSSFALTLKYIRDKTTKAKSFPGGVAKYKVKLSNDTFVDDWLDEGINPATPAKKVRMMIVARVRINGQTYESVVPIVYTGKPGASGSFIKGK